MSSASHVVLIISQIESVDESCIVRINLDDRIDSNLSADILEDSLSCMFTSNNSHVFEALRMTSLVFLRLLGAVRDKGWIILTSNSRGLEGNLVERKFYFEKKMNISKENRTKEQKNSSAPTIIDTRPVTKAPVQAAHVLASKPHLRAEDVSTLPSWRIALDLANKRKKLAASNVAAIEQPVEQSDTKTTSVAAEVSSKSTKQIAPAPSSHILSILNSRRAAAKASDAAKAGDSTEKGSHPKPNVGALSTTKLPAASDSCLPAATMQHTPSSPSPSFATANQAQDPSNEAAELDLKSMTPTSVVTSEDKKVTMEHDSVEGLNVASVDTEAVPTTSTPPHPLPVPAPWVSTSLDVLDDLMSPQSEATVHTSSDHGFSVAENHSNVANGNVLEIREPISERIVEDGQSFGDPSAPEEISIDPGTPSSSPMADDSHGRDECHGSNSPTSSSSSNCDLKSKNAEYFRRMKEVRLG